MNMMINDRISIIRSPIKEWTNLQFDLGRLSEKSVSRSLLWIPVHFHRKRGFWEKIKIDLKNYPKNKKYRDQELSHQTAQIKILTFL